MPKDRVSPYVLVVEDHPLVADSLAACVHDCVPQIDVWVVESLSAALQSIASRGSPALILTDLSLTDTSGFDVVRQLRGAAPASVLLIVTALDDPSLRRAAKDSGATAYIVKSTGIGAIREHIAAALADQPANSAGPLPRGPALEQLLTRAQIAVLVELASGLSNKEIAIRLKISDETVGSHMREILARLEARNRTEAVVRYLDLTSRSRVFRAR